MRVRRNHIERVARNVRVAAGQVQIPVDVDAVAATLGIEVRYGIFPKEHDREGEMSGFIYRAGSVPIIGVDVSQRRQRQRFTVAHELGHYLLHQNEYHMDNKAFYKNRNALSTEGTDVEEIEANLFAAELLMPSEAIEQELDGRNYVSEWKVSDLAKKFNVSLQAMTVRLTNLGYLN